MLATPDSPESIIYVSLWLETYVELFDAHSKSGNDTATTTWFIISKGRRARCGTFFIFFQLQLLQQSNYSVFQREEKMSRKQAVLSHCWSIVFKKQDKTFQKMPSEHVN